MSSFDSQSVLDKEETVSSIDYRARYDLICRASIKDNDAETISKTLESSLNELTDYITLDLAALARRGCPDDFADITELTDEQYNEMKKLNPSLIKGWIGTKKAGEFFDYDEAETIANACRVWEKLNGRHV